MNGHGEQQYVTGDPAPRRKPVATSWPEEPRAWESATPRPCLLR